MLCPFCFCQVGHNIYILCHQLAQHNKELAALLKPSDSNSDPKMNQALKYYATHTSQIEVSVPASTFSFCL
jgi:inositol 1,4,5-triphosphate receptor type 1